MLLDLRALRFIGTAPGWWAAAAVLRTLAALAGFAAAGALGFAVIALPGGWSTALTAAFAFTGVRLLASTAAGACLSRFSAAMTTALRQSLMDRLISLGEVHARTRRTSAAVTTVVDAAAKLSAYTAEYLTQLAAVLLSVPAGLAALMLLGLPGLAAALCVLAGIALTFAAQQIWRAVTKRAGQAVWQAQERYIADVSEALEKMATIIDTGGTRVIVERLGARAEALRQTAQHDLRVSLGSWTLTTVATALAGVGAIAALWLTGSASQLLLPAAFIVLEISRPLAELRTRWHEGFFGLIAARSVHALSEQRPCAGDDAAVPGHRFADVPQLRFRNITFSYPGQPDPVLSSLSCDIPAGCTTAVIGASGSGKSTLLSLLRRTDDRYTGEIVCSTGAGRDVELRSIPLSSCARAIAEVEQSPVLFDDTLRANIDPESRFTDAQITQMCTELGLGPLLAERGLDTPVGTGGSLLSGGQRARVSTARALLLDHPLLLLDEATSGLDGESEARLLEQIRLRRRGRTTIVVAHRPATIAAADHVIVLSAGQVIESGSVPELMAVGGFVHRVLSPPPLPSADQPDTPLPGAPVSTEPLLPERDRRSIGRGLRGLLRALRGHGRTFAGAAGAGVLAQVAEVVTVAAVLTVFAVSGSAAAGPGAGGVLLWIAAAGVVTAAIAHWLENYWSHLLSFDVSADLRNRLLRALCHLLPHGLGRRSPQALSAVLLRDAEKLEVFYAHTSIYLLTGIGVPLLGVAGLALLSPGFAMLLAACLAAGGLIPLVIRRRAAVLSATAAEARARLADTIAEVLGTIRQILAFDRREQTRRQIDDCSRAQAAAALRIGSLRGLEDAAVSAWVALVPLSAAAGLALFPELAADPALGLPASAWQLFLIAVAWALTGPVEHLIRVTRHSSETSSAVEQIDAVLTAEPLTAEPAAAEPRSASRMDADGADVRRVPAMHLDDISVRWPQADTCALRDVTATVPAQGITAVVGSSGAGKSTLVSALAGHLPLAGGRLITSAGCGPRAGGVITVAQNAALFHDTIRANLTLSRVRNPSDEQLMAALRAAAIEEIADHPEGLDRMLPGDGQTLSGGQRQRLALARALLAAPRMLILDEAVSQLDVDGEARLHAALRGLSERIPVLFVAHRLSSVLLADRILVFDAGTLAGAGTHAELLCSCPAYSSLVTPQLSAITQLPGDARPAPAGVGRRFSSNHPTNP